VRRTAFGSVDRRGGFRVCSLKETQSLWELNPSCQRWGTAVEERPERGVRKDATNRFRGNPIAPVFDRIQRSVRQRTP